MVHRIGSRNHVDIPGIGGAKAHPHIPSDLRHGGRVRMRNSAHARVSRRCTVVLTRHCRRRHGKGDAFELGAWGIETTAMTAVDSIVWPAIRPEPCSKWYAHAGYF